MTKYAKTRKIKYVVFYWKSRETNLSYFVITNLSCFSKNMCLHTNPSHNTQFASSEFDSVYTF